MKKKRDEEEKEKTKDEAKQKIKEEEERKKRKEEERKRREEKEKRERWKKVSVKIVIIMDLMIDIVKIVQKFVIKTVELEAIEVVL